jgi:hypothetical protein
LHYHCCLAGQQIAARLDLDGLETLFFIPARDLRPAHQYPERMKATTLILTGLAAFIGIKAFAKKKAADKLQFFVQKVSFRLSVLTPILDINVGISNPTSEPLRVASIVGELYINGTFVAMISGYRPTVIPGPGQTIFPISARLQASGIVQQGIAIVQAIQDGGAAAILNQVIRFKGNVLAEGITLPLDFTYKVL